MREAAQHGFNCNERAVRWDYHGLKYTYVALSLRYTGQKKNQSADDRRAHDRHLWERQSVLGRQADTCVP